LISTGTAQQPDTLQLSISSNMIRLNFIDNHDDIAKVLYPIERWHMLDNCCGVVVGLSGGADSVTLLHIMSCICSHYGLGIHAVHVNHGIRGDSADRDEAFCSRLCDLLNIELTVFHYDIPELSRQEGTGLEECGRKYRYKAFSEISEKYNYRIATAHTLSDCTETMMLNIVRGCGIAGLRGIPAVRDNIIRPLIRLSREDIEMHCRKFSLSYVTDESNFDAIYSRNHIRLNVLPELRKLNPEFDEAMLRLMECAVSDEDFLSAEAEKLLDSARIGEKEWQADLLVNAHQSVKNRAFMRIVQIITDKQCTFTHINLINEIIRTNTTGAVNLPGGKILAYKNGILFERCARTEQAQEWSVPFESELQLPDGRTMFVELVSYDEFLKISKKDKSVFKYSLRYDIISHISESCGLIVRNRRHGDRFTPSGRGVTKTLKKLLNEAHIPTDIRDSLVIIEVAGKIIWLESFGAAEGYAPCSDDELVCLIRFSEQTYILA